MNFIFSALIQGLCYGIVAVGVYVSYKILDFPDLSVDGTFPLGAVLSVVLVESGINPVAALIISLAAGACAGFVTGFLHVRFKISNLLSGIIVMTGLLSVNLVLSRKNGFSRASIIYSERTLFSGGFNDFLTGILRPALGVYAERMAHVLILLFIVLLFKLCVDLFLKTKAGFMTRAAGDNPQLVTSMGKNVGFYKILGLMLANGIVAAAGAVYSQQLNYYDTALGAGMVVTALASVIIGWSLFGRLRRMAKSTAVVLGAIIYSAFLTVAIIVIETSYLRLMMAALFAGVLILNNSSLLSRRGLRNKKGGE